MGRVRWFGEWRIGLAEDKMEAHRMLGIMIEMTVVERTKPVSLA